MNLSQISLRAIIKQYRQTYNTKFGPGSVVGIETGYGLEGPGIESR